MPTANSSIQQHQGKIGCIAFFNLLGFWVKFYLLCKK